MKNTPKNISIDKLYPFEGHPFKVQDNEEMNALTLSIQEQGILSPLIAVSYTHLTLPTTPYV